MNSNFKDLRKQNPPPQVNAKLTKIRLKALSTHCKDDVCKCISTLVKGRAEIDIGVINTAIKTYENYNLR